MFIPRDLVLIIATFTPNVYTWARASRELYALYRDDVSFWQTIANHWVAKWTLATFYKKLPHLKIPYALATRHVWIGIENDVGNMIYYDALTFGNALIPKAIIHGYYSPSKRWVLNKNLGLWSIHTPDGRTILEAWRPSGIFEGWLNDDEIVTRNCGRIGIYNIHSLECTQAWRTETDQGVIIAHNLIITYGDLARAWTREGLLLWSHPYTKSGTAYGEYIVLVGDSLIFVEPTTGRVCEEIPKKYNYAYSKGNRLFAVQRPMLDVYEGTRLIRSIVACYGMVNPSGTILYWMHYHQKKGNEFNLSILKI